MPNTTSKSSENNAPDTPRPFRPKRKEHRLAKFISEHRVGELGVQHWLRKFGVFNRLGFLVRIYRLGFFFAVHCLVPELHERVIGFIGIICALGTVVQVGA